MFLRIGKNLIRFDKLTQVYQSDNVTILYLTPENGTTMRLDLRDEDHIAFGWFLDTFGAQFNVNNVTEAYKNREAVEKQVAAIKQAVASQQGPNAQETLPRKPFQKVQSIKRDEILQDEQGDSCRATDEGMPEPELEKEKWKPLTDEQFKGLQDI